MGLLDTIIDAAKRGAGLLAPTQADVDFRSNMPGLVADFTPVIGDAKSAYDGIQAARQGNYGEAALNGLGLLPFVPAFGGILDAKRLGTSLETAITQAEKTKQKISNAASDWRGREYQDTLKEVARKKGMDDELGYINVKEVNEKRRARTVRGLDSQLTDQNQLINDLHALRQQYQSGSPLVLDRNGRGWDAWQSAYGQRFDPEIYSHLQSSRQIQESQNIPKITEQETDDFLKYLLGK